MEALFKYKAALQKHVELYSCRSGLFYGNVSELFGNRKALRASGRGEARRMQG